MRLHKVGFEFAECRRGIEGRYERLRGSRAGPDTGLSMIQLPGNPWAGAVVHQNFTEVELDQRIQLSIYLHEVDKSGEVVIL